MKKVLICIITCLLLCSCSNGKSDSEKFKKEYESYNKEKYYAVDIDKKNPFIYTSVDNINELVDENEYFALFIGLPTDDLSRHLVEIIIKETKNLKISKIYYLPDDENNVSDYKSNNGISKDIPILIAYANGKIEGIYDLSNEDLGENKTFDDINKSAISSDVKQLLKKSINLSCKNKKSC